MEMVHVENMFKNAHNFSTILLALLICSSFLQLLESAPNCQHHISTRKRSNTRTRHELPMAYKKYVRRRPTKQFGDQDIFEVHEVYLMPKLKPRVEYLLTDEDVDAIIRCDFNPTLNECKNLKGRRTSMSITTTTSPSPLTSTLRPITPTTRVANITRLLVMNSTSSSTTSSTLTAKTTRKPTMEELASTKRVLSTTSTDLPLLPETSDLPENNGNKVLENQESDNELVLDHEEANKSNVTDGAGYDDNDDDGEDDDDIDNEVYNYDEEGSIGALDMTAGS